MPFATLETGTTLHYEDINPEQQGTPIIMIHGLLGTARYDYGDSLEWAAGLGYRVLGPSLRGYGQSTPKPRDFPYRFYHRDTDDLIAFMDALQIEKAHIIGYSDGGEVALIAASHYPDRCQSVVAIGAVGNFGPELRPVFQRSYPGTWITDEEKAMHSVEDAYNFTLGWVRSNTRMLDAGGDVSLSKAHLVTCPLMIVLGETDTLNPAKYGEYFVAKMPAGLGRVEVFACGHGVHQELPEEFRKRVGPFIKSADR